MVGTWEFLKRFLTAVFMLFLVVNDILFLLLLFIVEDDYHLPPWGWGMFGLFIVSLFIFVRRLENGAENR